MSSTKTITSLPATVTMVGYVQTFQLAGLQGVVDRYNPGATAVAVGWVNGDAIDNVNTQWWLMQDGSYCWTGFTDSRPGPLLAKSQDPPATNLDQAIAAANAEAAAAGNPIAVVSNGVKGIWNGFTGAVSSAVNSVTSGAVGNTITDLLWLIVVVFLIYAILKTGSLNLVHFKKKEE